ncbi:LacI family transcriptional regulator [Tessaracoccus rhinocerotis]|uniref:LacI family transcriptional regulator n=1 Tax=Tessaracoccus rhinocerotis TaxID=1689449 RepID=A0A553K4M3_9ACTN|nr:LacI family DNA-binding transcriptional regulator [Tessaracoccus rhinocerotis]TRY19656.1 LacI family transcriptional regulator [Tessaracoccus rhinocerotis]
MPHDDPKPVTIYDVARVAGVSASTVSRTFARPGRVSFSTAQRIKQVALELGYRAVELRVSVAEGAQRHGTIALVVADITNPVNFDMIRGAEEEAARHNYTMLLAHTRESAIVEREALERVLDSVDGIVLSSSRMSDSGIRAMAKQKPTLVINRGVTGVASVVSDNARGMRRAIEHIGELGHRDIAYLGGPEASWAHGMRWRALKEGAHELGLNVTLVESPAPTKEGGEAIAESVLATGATAVVGYNDLLALGFMQRARELGRDVPGDVSVVGFDNSVFASLTTPGLTSVAAPMHAMGATGVRNLLGMAGNTMADPFRPIVLPTRLVVRGSTGAPPRG